MDVTFPEWAEYLKDLADKVSVRWPDVEVSLSREHTLGVQLRDVMSGIVDLRIPQRERNYLAVVVSVDGSGGLPRDLSVAQSKISDMQRLLNVLHYCNAACQGICVFREGECPCAACGGEGKTRAGKCTPCDGKGVR